MGHLLSHIRSSVLGIRPVASGTTAVAIVLIAATGAGAFGAAGSPGTRGNPYPRGKKAVIDTFAISVVGVDANAWSKLHRASPSNVAPRSGMTYVLVTMRARNQGATASIPLVNGVPNAIGRSNRVYSPFEGCGVIPHNIASLSGVAPGRIVTASTCWTVRKADVSSLVLFYAPYDGGKRIFFGLR